ncbi:uncharacterized protein [Primulina eburnea]|uniref:uncharacterized protein n=1 Tax=Primulina eburnea TaxID=1245227 RepID=UPI003C6C7591
MGDREECYGTLQAYLFIVKKVYKDIVTRLEIDSIGRFKHIPSLCATLLQAGQLQSRYLWCGTGHGESSQDLCWRPSSTTTCSITECLSPHPSRPSWGRQTTLILERLLDKWNTSPHITGYIDFAESVEDHHPKQGQSFPWTSWSICPAPKLVTLKAQLENCLESMTQKAIQLGTISSQQIFTILTKWHSPTTALNRILNLKGDAVNYRVAVRNKNRVTTSHLWDSAVFKLSAGLSEQEMNGDFDASINVEEGSYYKEAMAALKLAKEVIKAQAKWRVNAIRDLNSKGGFSRSLANSATDWPCLLLELLSLAAEMDYFQVISRKFQILIS